MVSATYGSWLQMPIRYRPMGVRGRTWFASVGALALATCAAGCASAGGATPRPFPGAAVPRPPAVVATAPPDEAPPPSPGDPAMDALVATALQLLGVPYQN